MFMFEGTIGDEDVKSVLGMVWLVAADGDFGLSPVHDVVNGLMLGMCLHIMICSSSWDSP